MRREGVHRPVLERVLDIVQRRSEQLAGELGQSAAS
jgi:hypothetical protein